MDRLGLFEPRGSLPNATGPRAEKPGALIVVVAGCYLCVAVIDGFKEVLLRPQLSLRRQRIEADGLSVGDDV